MKQYLFQCPSIGGILHIRDYNGVNAKLKPLSFLQESTMEHSEPLRHFKLGAKIRDVSLQESTMEHSEPLRQLKLGTKIRDVSNEIWNGLLAIQSHCRDLG